MVKTIKQLADELGVSKQTIQYHYQRLPTKDQQKDSEGKNLISPLAESIIKDRVSKPLLAKNHQNDSKDPTKDSKEENDLITTLRREVRDLKSERDKQLATKDRQIDRLTKLLDQQQRLQLTTVTENKELKKIVQRLNNIIESSEKIEKDRRLKDSDKELADEGKINNNGNQTKNHVTKSNNSKKQIYENKTTKNWWHFWWKRDV